MINIKPIGVQKLRNIFPNNNSKRMVTDYRQNNLGSRKVVK